MSPDLAKNSAGGPVVAVIQARLGSVRFPNKVLKEFSGRTMISTMVDRVRCSSLVDQVVVAIPGTRPNDTLANHLRDNQIDVFRGEEKDVLGRVWGAASSRGAGVVARLTGDCPLLDWEILDRCVEAVVEGGVDLAVTSPLFPDGLDVEVFRLALLDEANRLAESDYDREHVTPFMRRKYASSICVVEPTKRLRPVRVTLDEPEDFDVITGILRALRGEKILHGEIDNLAIDNPTIFEPNSSFTRNDGATMHSGEKLWKRAEKVIAGGNMLLSKRPNIHLPKGWPSYFSRAKGCRVWDLDSREFIDIGFMGVGTNILGYGHPKVDEAVHGAIESGNLSTLNAPEEVVLAEKLLDLHPWAQMARFTRSGGEAGAVAVRLARAATGKDRVVVCGYHGWHDWYLAANLADDSRLDGHLLPGLNPGGVPRALQGTTVTFKYNDFVGFREAVALGDVAAIVMEVERSENPAPGFLEEVRKTASEIGAVLIFDECTSGFRQVLGGHHLTLGINPDVAIFGKTLGNGYAINAIIGIEPVMSAVAKTFVSSTFWTERIGSVAAVAALDVMEQTAAPERIHNLGLRLREIWSACASAAGLSISVSGLPALSRFLVEGVSPSAASTFLTRSFLNRGFLAGEANYASIAHEEVLEHPFSDFLAEILAEMGDLVRTGALDEGEVEQSGFARLN